ncbi:MAG: hypothetical protein A3G23_07295 [Bacteroidetes bacterium RIFCSPLOWO2_12_FULL_37_12]|nr:MAG: hypothetical protein A3G23_07295 [Bacteroidetes bacterium RIFCSPLOWO2_12_FULL_37_12]
MITLKNTKPFWIAIFVLLNSFNIVAQPSDKYKIEAMFLYNFTKYVEWKNQSQWDTFQIGILGNDTSMLNAINWMAETKTAKGKPIVPMLYKNPESIKSPQMLYVDKNSNFEMQEILSAIKGKNILLTSSNYEFNTSMINFIVVKDKLKYELVEKRIIDEGFTIKPELINLSVKSSNDWKNLFLETEKLLETEKDKVVSQKDEINKQKAIIEKQNDDIMIQYSKIELMKKEFSNLVFKAKNQQDILDKKTQILSKQEREIVIQKSEIVNQKDAIERQRQILMGQQDKIQFQQNQITKQESTLQYQLITIESQRIVLYSFILVIFLISAVIFLIYRGYINKKKTNKQLEENNKAITKQKQLLEEKNKEMLESIHYARLIQEAILPKHSEIKEHFPEIFILYKPKDIVSGDFYWFALKGERSIIAACDCTGHGVPGAFVSMVGNDLLNQIIIERNIDNPSEILKKLHDGIVYALGHKTKDTPLSDSIRDGMDIALCTIDMNKNEIMFSGAIRPMWLITKNGAQHSAEFKRTVEGDYELVEIAGDRFGIGGAQIRVDPTYTTHKIAVQSGDTFYMFSDGYTDQFGGKGERDKKFSKKRLLKLLLSIQHLNMDEQREKLDMEFVNWRGKYEQTDDICVIGIRI